MSKLPIYCSAKFLINFYKDLISLKKSNNQSDENILVIALAFNKLLKNADLYFSFDGIEVKEFLDNKSVYFSPHLSQLISNNNQKQRTEYSVTTNTIDNFRNTVLTQPHAIFILDSDIEIQLEDCKDIEAKFGVICFKHTNWKEKADFLLNWAMFTVIKKTTNKFKDWKEITKFQHPCNAIVIADNYVLKDKQEIEDNIVQILDNLLPKTLLTIPFQITFLVDEKDLAGNKLSLRYNELTDKLKIIRPQLIIELTIFLVNKEDNHDRNIFTNYLWLHSGHSFAYFGEINNRFVAKKSTNLIIFPITYQNINVMTLQTNSTFEAVEMLRKEAKDIIKKGNEPKPPKNNRLL